MDRLAQVPQDQLAQELEAEFRSYMQQVMEAVNAAPDGRLIEASEVQVNDLMNRFKTQVYQRALQARIDASETAAAKSPAAFSPYRRRSGTA